MAVGDRGPGSVPWKDASSVAVLRQRWAEGSNLWGDILCCESCRAGCGMQSMEPARFCKPIWCADVWRVMHCSGKEAAEERRCGGPQAARG